MRVFRIAVVCALALGCGLEESGLVDQEDASPDAPSVTDSATDSAPATDSATATDAATATDSWTEPTTDSAPSVDVVTLDAPPPPPTFAITGGTYTIDAPDGGKCSTGGQQSIMFELQNERDASVDLVWVTYQCDETLYATVTAGNAVNQQTYVDNVWRVRNTSDQSLLGEFSLTQNANYVVTVH